MPSASQQHLLNYWGTMIGIAVIALSSAGGLQHVITCCVLSKWMLLVTGLLLAPLGVVHGWGVWAGFW